MKTFPRPPDGLLQAVGAAKRRPMQKPLRTFRSQRLLCFCYASARSRSLKIRSVDLLGDLLRTEIDDDNAVGFPGLPFIGVEIKIDVLGVFLGLFQSI